MNLDVVKVILGIFGAIAATFAIIKLFRLRELKRARLVTGLGTRTERITRLGSKIFGYKELSPPFVVFRMPPKNCPTSLASIPIFIENVGKRRSGDLLIEVRYSKRYLPEPKTVKKLLKVLEPDEEHEKTYLTDGEIRVGRDAVHITYRTSGVFENESQIINEYLCIKHKSTQPAQRKQDKSPSARKDEILDLIDKYSDVTIPISVTVFSEDVSPVVNMFNAIFISGESLDDVMKKWISIQVIITEKLLRKNFFTKHFRLNALREKRTLMMLGEWYRNSDSDRVCIHMNEEDDRLFSSWPIPGEAPSNT